MFKILQTYLIVLLLLITNRQIINGQQNVRFHEIRHWKYINFTWPNELIYQNAVNTNQYIPDNILISGIKNFDNFYYITLPRMKNGVPATLARIPMEFNNNEPSPKFEPYPSWSMNAIDDNCNNLHNVQNIEIDNRNGQLWIIDVGRIQTLTQQPINRCPPKLIIYNIRENRTIIVYNFPENIANSNSSYLYDLVIDNTEDGGGSYAYITDNSATDPGIIVYSLRENHSWKIRQHRSMFADQTNFVVNGVMITAPINIAGIALGPRINKNNTNNNNNNNNNNNHENIVINDDRSVYFSPLSSKHLYSINTTILRNEQYLKMNHNLDGIIKDHGMKSSQSVGMIMDDHGVLYYGLLELNAIGQWDTLRTNFQNGQKLIAQDAKFIEWPNSFTFDNNGNLIVLINRLNRFIFQRFDRNQINFRLISANLGGRSYINTNDNQFNYQRINDSSSTNIIIQLTSSPPPPPQPLPPLIHQHLPSSGYKSLSINFNVLIGIHLLLSTLMIC